MTLEHTAVGPHAHAGVWADGATAVEVVDADLSGGPYSQTLAWGAALVARRIGAWDGAAGLRLSETELHGAGVVAVLLDDASGSFEGVTWSDNGLDVLQQRCGGRPSPVGDLGRAELCPEHDLLLVDLDYTVQFTDAVAER